MDTQKKLGPTQATERIVAIDIVRALVLFGVLLVNMLSFSGIEILERMGTSLPHTLGLGMVVAFYALQVPVSRWWLTHFKFGPAEWAWWSMTYGSLQPFKASRILAPQE
jgi:uncharacterized membrane protein YeiB